MSASLRARRRRRVVTGHRTVSGGVAEAIRALILDGTLAPGEALRQDALAERLGVSRIPVREALFQLEAEGLISFVPQKGATVSSLSPERMEETYAIRLALEPDLLRRSAARLTDDDLDALAAQLATHAESLSRGRSEEWGPLNTEFHLALYARADRPRTLALVASLLRECDRYTRIQLQGRVVAQDRAQREHETMLALCREGRGEEAAALLRDHIGNVAEEAWTLARTPPPLAARRRRG